MEIETGATLYRYTVKRGRLVCEEGVVNECATRKLVIFSNTDDRAKSVRCPRVEDLGVIRHIGPNLWLGERDDDFARKIFIDFEEHKIILLQNQINTKRRTVKALKGELGV